MGWQMTDKRQKTEVGPIKKHVKTKKKRRMDTQKNVGFHPTSSWPRQSPCEHGLYSRLHKNVPEIGAPFWNTLFRRAVQSVRSRCAICTAPMYNLCIGHVRSLPVDGRFVHHICTVSSCLRSIPNGNGNMLPLLLFKIKFALFAARAYAIRVY